MTEVERSVAGYAAEVVGAGAAVEVTGVRRFESGERHHVFRVSYAGPAGAGGDVVVRIAATDETRDRARAEREAAVLARVQEVAAPALLDFRAASRWFDVPSTCVRFVPGHQRALEEVPLGDVEQLGRVVGEVHALPTDDLDDRFPGPKTIDGYFDAYLATVAERMRWVREPLPGALQHRLREAWGRIRDEVSSAAEATDDRLVLTHGDIAAGNIIWSTTPVLIDWEYARLADAADEVAYVFGQHDLGPLQRAAFWRGYRMAATGPRVDEIVRRVRSWEPLNLLGSVLWWTERATRRSDADAAATGDAEAPKPQRHYLDGASRRLERLERSLDPAPGGT